MRILFISGDLIGSALIHRLQAEGHDLRVYIEAPYSKHCLDGFVEKVDDWSAQLSWVGHDGLIVFDDITFAGAQEHLRAQGYRVMGGDSQSDRLELDRAHFTNVLREHGVATLPLHTFGSAEAAREFIAANPARWVLKHSTHMSTATYVGQLDDGRDVLELLRLYETKAISPIHLQRAVDGIEIGVARYFNGNDWLGPIEVNVEHKALFPSNFGPLTCAMGTLIWYDEDEDLPLYARTLRNLEAHLRSIEYKGDIDINCIVNEAGIWPLEATMRFGSPATQVQCELHRSPWGAFLGAVADGRSFDLDYAPHFAVGVTVAMPPFPFGEEFLTDRTPALGSKTQVFVSDELSDADWQKLHFEEVVTQEVDGRAQYHHRGGNGYALFVTGSGDTPRAAQRDAYRIIENISMPRMFYRNDIGERFIASDGDQLRAWGVI